MLMSLGLIEPRVVLVAQPQVACERAHEKPLGRPTEKVRSLACKCARRSIIALDLVGTSKRQSEEGATTTSGRANRACPSQAKGGHFCKSAGRVCLPLHCGGGGGDGMRRLVWRPSK